MYPELNPFSPGSGLRPPALVGRQKEIDAFDLIVARSRQKLHNRGIVLHGLRGVGKTVLLNQFRDQAVRADWFVVELEGRDSDTGKAAVRQKLGRALLQAASRASRAKTATAAMRKALGTVKSFSLSVGVASVDIGIDPEQGRGDSGQVEIDFEELVEDLAPALLDSSRAFGLFIDEMQDLDRELLVALLAAQHRAGQQGWPFYIFGAGLPNLPSKLSEARSYAERLFDYRRVGPLEPAAATAALVEPTQAYGAEFTPEALSLLLGAADGYPYFLQTFGRAAWDAAPEKLIADCAALTAIKEGNAALDMGFFPARWDRATPAERKYLRAMSDMGVEHCKTSEIARQLNSSMSAQSAVRQGIIEKGIAYAPERGLLAFTVPGMHAFIRRQFGE